MVTFSLNYEENEENEINMKYFINGVVHSINNTLKTQNDKIRFEAQ